MEEQSKEYWKILCEQASKEQNPEQFMKLIHELNEVLEQRDGPKRSDDAA